MSERPAKPLTPKEAIELKRQNTPRAVFDAFNQLLSQGKSGNSKIVFSDKQVVALMEQKGLSPQEIYNRGWLNIEDLYEEAGWNVTRSGSDSDDAITHYTFTPKKAE